MLGGRPNRAPARCAAPIGSALAAQLHSFGICTTADLTAMAPASARDLGTVVLERLVRELNCFECDGFKPKPEASKATAVTRQFGVPVTDLDALREAMVRRAARAAEKIRHQGLVATWLIVFAHGRYRPNPPLASRQSRMSPPSNDPRIIAGLAAKMIEAMYQPGGVYTKCGVLLEELLPQGAGQGRAGQGTSLPSRIRACAGCWPLWIGSTIGSGVGPSGTPRRRFGARAFDTKRKPKKPGMDDTLRGDPGRPLGRSRARQKKGEAEHLPLLQRIILVMIGDSAESSTLIAITEPSVPMSQVCAFC
jgi:DNA polymerase V